MTPSAEGALIGAAALPLPQMARLLAGSKGETAMSEETWKAVMAMEHQREERVRVV